MQIAKTVFWHCTGVRFVRAVPCEGSVTGLVLASPMNTPGNSIRAELRLPGASAGQM